jgi:hypothetical protein
MDISPCAVSATEIGNNFRIKKFFVWEFGDDHGRVPVNIPVTVHFASTVPWPAKFIVTVFPTTVPVNLALLSKLPLGRLGTATVVNEPASAPPPVTVPKTLIVTVPFAKLPVPETSELFWSLTFRVAKETRVTLLPGF